MKKKKKRTNCWGGKKSNETLDWIEEMVTLINQTIEENQFIVNEKKNIKEFMIINL